MGLEIQAQDERRRMGGLGASMARVSARNLLPDELCTPGAVDPAVTQENIAATICQSGYTTRVRPPLSATAPMKDESLLDYGEPYEHTTEYDHLVPLELGGANSVSNLWAEPN